MQMKPRDAVLWFIYGLLVAGMLFFAISHRSIIFAITAGATLINPLSNFVQRWRLRRYGDQIERRMKDASANPAADPDFKN